MRYTAKTGVPVIMAGVLLLFAPGPAAEAQTLEDLRARVAALEANEA